jgi:hypothetical protein
VKARTTLLLLRFRFHLQSLGPDRQPIELLAEDLVTVGFTGTPAKPEWLATDATSTLLAATAAGNIDPAAARDHLAQALGATASLMPAILEIGNQRGAELLDAHRRVRKVAKSRTKIKGVALLPPVDLLGAYIYLPAPAKAGA